MDEVVSWNPGNAGSGIPVFRWGISSRPGKPSAVKVKSTSNDNGEDLEEGQDGIGTND